MHVPTNRITYLQLIMSLLALGSLDGFLLLSCTYGRVTICLIHTKNKRPPISTNPSPDRNRDIIILYIKTDWNNSLSITF